MRYHFQVRNEEIGYSAFCLELEGCRSEGDTIEALKTNLEEALNLYLEEPAGSNMVFPLPKSLLEGQEGILSIPVDPKVAFAMLVRYQRITHRMSQAEVTKAMGFHSRNSYTRLESHANPSLETIAKVKKVFPEFPVEECFA